MKGSSYDVKSILKDRMPDQSSPLTRITLSVPSSSLTDDLWLRHGAPAKIRVGSFLAETSSAWGITLYVLFSVLAGVWAGPAAFGAKLVPFRRLATYGLGNLLTMIGFLLLVRHLTIPAPPSSESAPPEASPVPPGRKRRDPRKTRFVILFYAFFIALTSGSALILSTVL